MFMLFIVLISVLFFCGCTGINVPQNFTYKEIQTAYFNLASWQKIENNAPQEDKEKNTAETKAQKVFKVYIEGDGNAFNAHGQPTANPTPCGNFLRQIAFGDTNENIIYLARPCQFINENKCKKIYWTSGRFAKEVISSIAQAIYNTAGNMPVILIGFSGGAQIAGLIAVLYPEINVKKIITISGNLDHKKWTMHHKVPPLKASLNLGDYKDNFIKFDQINYAGEKDKTIPPQLILDFAGAERTIIVPKAKHAAYPKGIIEEIRQAI